VVGESGCGKSTLARQLALIETPPPASCGSTASRSARPTPRPGPPLRRQVQMVFQNPFAA
jgi:dipeptide transport system ATP-binding protein